MTTLVRSKIKNLHSEDEADALPTCAPGLVITEWEGMHGIYRLTHQRSGMAASSGGTDDVFGLLRIAAKLQHIDWTRDADEVVAQASAAKPTPNEVMNAGDVVWTHYASNHTDIRAASERYVADLSARRNAGQETA